MPMNDEHNMDDVVYDEENPELDPKGSLKKIREKLKISEEKAQEYLTGWQKAKADLVNLRKEDEKRMSEKLKFAEQNLILDLLPVIDSFDMAFANKKTWEELPKEWRTGVEYIHSNLMNTLSRYGAETIDPLGQEFNPEYQEAVGTIETGESSEDHKVLEVIQKGFKMHDKVIRTAKVKVGEYNDSTRITNENE